VEKQLILIGSLEVALNHLSIKWLNWNEFKGKRRRFKWNTNEKTSKKQFRFEYIITGVNYEDNLNNIHLSLVNHARIG
jgi:hypothetical protein